MQHPSLMGYNLFRVRVGLEYNRVRLEPSGGAVGALPVSVKGVCCVVFVGAAAPTNSTNIHPPPSCLGLHATSQPYRVESG